MPLLSLVPDDRLPAVDFIQSTTQMTELPSSRLRLRGGLKWRALRPVLAVLVLLAPSSLASPQESSRPQRGPKSDYTISVKVNEVVLHATVLDRKGVLVSGLNQEQFQVYEDGLPQEIKHFSHEDVPVTVGLVVDNSGSMKGKRADVVAAGVAFAQSSNPQDQMFVVNFNEKVFFGLPDNMPFTGNVAHLQTALSRIAADGETALYDAVAAALDHLKAGSHDKKVLIVISDGGDNASKHNLTQIRSMAGHPDAIIYTIGIFDEQDGDRNPRVLKELAKDTGGEAFLPESLKEIVPICEKIARDIRSQYTIAYVPTNRKPDGTYRSIQVKVNALGHKRLSVRTRTGYYAPPTTPPSPTAKATP